MFNESIIINAKIFAWNTFLNGYLTIRDGKILKIEKGMPETADCSRDIIDAKGQMLIPGFVDIHTHGAVGFNFMNSYDNSNVLSGLSHYYASTGTTSVMASTYTESYDNIKKTLQSIGEYIKTQEEKITGTQIIGINIEGPYINADKKGAQNADYIRTPNTAEFNELISLSKNNIRLFTIAPEVEGALEAIDYLHKRNISVSIGHSCADYETACKAIDRGATSITHYFNALSPFNHKEPGVVGAGLVRDDVILELICDGNHVHADLIKYLLKSKGAERIAFVTDSVFMAGCDDGEYIHGGLDYIKKDGKITLKNGDNLAGSCLTMRDAFKNAVRFTGMPLENIIPAFTMTPAKAVKINNKKGSLEIGKDADFILLDDNLTLQSTYVKGKRVYEIA